MNLDEIHDDERVASLLAGHTPPPPAHIRPEWDRVVAAANRDSHPRPAFKRAGTILTIIGVAGLVGVLAVLLVARPTNDSGDEASPATVSGPPTTDVRLGPVTLEGPGMRLDIPKGWTGRSKVGGTKGSLPILQAGNFPLPSSDDDLGSSAESLLPNQGIYINIIHYSPESAPRLTDPTVKKLPLKLELSDFGAYEGAIAANHARVSVIDNGEYFVVDAALGDDFSKAPQLLGDANNVLASFRPK